MLAWSQLVQDQLMLDGPELALVHWYRTVQDFEVLQKGSGRGEKGEERTKGQEDRKSVV